MEDNNKDFIIGTILSAVLLIAVVTLIGSFASDIATGNSFGTTIMAMLGGNLRP